MSIAIPEAAIAADTPRYSETGANFFAPPVEAGPSEINTAGLPYMPSEQVRVRAAELLREWGRPDLAENVRDRPPYKPAYRQALRQLREENPELNGRESRRLARQAARSVAYDEAEGIFGFYAAPEQEGRIGANVCNVLRRAGHKLAAVKGLGRLQLLAGEVYRKAQDLPPAAKIAVAGLGAVAASVPLLAQTYEGIQNTVESTVSNLEVFQQPTQND